MKKYILSIIAILTTGLFTYSQITISSARSQGSGATVTVSGIVTHGSELGSSIRYFQDETGGIAAYSYDLLSSVNKGDSIVVTGTLKDYNGLLELDPVSSVNVIAGNKTPPEPVLLTPNQLGESYEGQLVKIENVVFDDPGSTFDAKTNYYFGAGGQSGQVRINDAASPFVGRVIPSYPVIITGVLSEYSGTYQILVRGLEDILSTSSVNLITAPIVSDLSQTGFTISWTTDSVSSTQVFYGSTTALEGGMLEGSGNVTEHSLTISGSNPSTLYYLQAFSVRGEDTAKASVTVAITVSESSGEIKCYFNRTVDNSKSLNLGLDAYYAARALDDSLIAYINRAQESIDFTIYNFNNADISNISNALNAAHNRGVVVRMVYDSNTDNAGIDDITSGIGKIAGPESDYPNYGIMHNKFVVFDALSSDPDVPVVWTGSTNFTDGQINTDPNSVIIIQDKSLAMAYRLEFNEMFGSEGAMPNTSASKFGPDKTDNTPHDFIINGEKVECYFSPSDRTNRKILEVIESADDEIDVATMLITRTDIAYALRDKNNSGVNTQVLVNNEENCDETVVSVLKESLGEDFKITGESGIMHHKYMIVDQAQSDSDPTLLVGCHNWSSSAEIRNDENTLVIHSQKVANAYYQEFSVRMGGGSFLIDAPECVNDFVTMTGGSSLSYDVLYNDDLPGAVTVSVIKDPINGTASFNTDQTLTYTPNSNFNLDIDTVVYRAALNSNQNVYSEASFIVYVNLPVSSAQDLWSKRLSVFPVPADESLTIESEKNIAAFRVSDLTGKLLIHKEMESADRTIHIDVSNLKKGVYLLVAQCEGGLLSSEKIVIK
ncbi:MAG: T9SS type A sorting domain-containing protein [Bacteroidales bacterium]|nr:T9SS type A sorting domain-containing protein [Bacteroidales bacterium]MBN2820976.1 T9SS type A sorting domain-containing protein [Bacteroidales bacterium]